MTDAEQPDRPRAVTWSFWVWIAATGVGLIGAIELFRTAPPPGHLLVGPVDQRDSIIAVGVTLTAWSIARLVFACFLLRGHRWARILLTTLAALGLAFVISHAQHSSAWNGIAAAMNAAAVVLQFLPSANAYFAGGGVPRATGEYGLPAARPAGGEDDVRARQQDGAA